MSKAFLRDTDDDDDDDLPERKSIPGKNYITPQGLKKLHDEFFLLKNTERPLVTQTVSWAAGNGDRSENGDYTYGKKRLREIDKRLRFLAKRIESAEVIDPITIQSPEIRFGATVEVQDAHDAKKTYYIIGADETDAARGKISWQSPLAMALMKKEAGDVITYRVPSGVLELEILSVSYGVIPE